MKSKHLFLLSTFLFVACFTPGIFASPPQGSTQRFHHERPYPAFLENLPEMEQARFKKLFRENPETFRKEIRAYWKSEFEKQKAELDAIGKRYRETTDAELRKQLEQELRNKISQQFDKHQKFAEKQIRSYEKRIGQMQKRLDHLKKQTENKKLNRQNDIDKIVKKVLEGETQTEKK